MTGSPALAGFLLSGFLFALLGAMLPAWGYHLAGTNTEAALYFLAVGLGMIASGEALRFFPNWRVPSLLTAGCGVACGALIGLALAPPPASALWRDAGWFAIGIAAGWINTALFEAIRPAYRTSPADTVNTGGIYFSVGCVGSCLLVAGTFYLYSVASILLLAGIIPAGFSLFFERRALTFAPRAIERPFREVFRDFLSPGAVMFAILLFFQAGNEWTVAGWLPLYLIHQLGTSPETAVWMLTLYWFALLAGRIAVLYLLPAVRHGRLLFGSAGAALSGCVLLLLTDNRFGAITGILLAAAGFAAIYPLVAEKLGARFPYYHPGVFNSIFSVALAGGMIAPCIAGLLSDHLGLWVIMGMPVLGTFMVVALLLLIWLESKVTGRST